MSRILVISGHPDIEQSVANKKILADLQARYGNELEIDALYAQYGDFRIDVAAEQQKLLEAEVVVFQFPVHWYAVPALVQKWFEDVIQFGFGYGVEDTKLIGKKVIYSFTTGSKEEVYTKEASGFEQEDFLRPIKAACKLCGMEFLGYAYTGGIGFTVHNDAEARAEAEQRLAVHSEKVAGLIDEALKA